MGQEGMEPPQRNGEAEAMVDCADVDDRSELQRDAMGQVENFEEVGEGVEPSKSKCVEQEDLKTENSTLSPRVVRKEQSNSTEGLRKGKEGGSKGSGRGGGKAASGLGKEGGKRSKVETNRTKSGDGVSRSSETIEAAGLPSMRRTKSQPERSRSEEKKETMQGPCVRRDRPSVEAALNWAAWAAWLKVWVDYQEPARVAIRDFLLQLRARIEFRVKKHWPSVRAWLLLFARVMLMLSLVGLEAAIRGFASFIRLGSAAHFLLLWCTICNFIRLAGFFNLLIALALGTTAVFVAGYTLAIAMLSIFGGVVLWLYGSFWMTGAVIIIGGALFAANSRRLAVFITMVYSLYCMKNSGGWLGLLFCTVVAFISSDLALYFLSTVEKEEKFTRNKAEHTPSPQQKTFNGKAAKGSVPYTESYQATSDAARTSTGASTSGINEGDPLSAEEEVARVLGCTDHYAVLGFARYDTFDISSLKREYRKKAMLVHPDKNGGNDKAEEAFKRLQNAYEVLLDAVKRKCYDDELRREELLMTIRKHHIHGNGRNGTPDCGCRMSEDDGDEDVPAGSRRIACKKCGKNHMWVSTNKTKLRARWCQECQDHHPAKDGDGWVEQTGQSIFFGMFQKVDIPHAYACADGNVYDVTEWVLCQGLKCPPNMHKPTFHVNTTGIGKSPTRPPRSSKGTPSGHDGFNIPDFDNNMTEQEFFEWLQNAMASGAFNDLNGGVPSSGKAPPAKPGTTKTRGKKKKGKKQW